MNNGWRRFGSGLLAGLILGAASAALWHGASRRPRPHDPKAHHARLRRKFEERLRLDGDQRAAIEQLINKRHAELRDIHKQMDALFDGSRARTRAAIRAELRPEQIKAFAKMTAEWDAKRAARRARGRHHR